MYEVKRSSLTAMSNSALASKYKLHSLLLGKRRSRIANATMCNVMMPYSAMILRSLNPVSGLNTPGSQWGAYNTMPSVAITMPKITLRGQARWAMRLWRLGRSVVDGQGSQTTIKSPTAAR